MIDTCTYVHPSGKLVSVHGSHIIYSKYELSAKVETMILKNDVFTTVTGSLKSDYTILRKYRARCSSRETLHRPQAFPV